MPLVSAVIPTRNRQELVCCAVRSALRQTYGNLEVIVVVDGPDPATVRALATLNEPRVRIVSLEESVGGSEARNIGVREARGEWIALLDDDDEWLPQKIEMQIAALYRSRHKWPISVCRVIRRRSGGDSILPLRMPEFNEPMSEYLLCRRSIAHGESLVQTSMIVVHKDLLMKEPFRANLPRFQDWDWLLRVAQIEGFGMDWVWKPLVIYNMTPGLQRVTSGAGWSDALQWARDNSLLTARAFSYFVAVQIAPRLNIVHDFSHLPGLIADLFRHGKFEMRALVYGTLFALTPHGLRRHIAQRNLLHRM